MSHAQNFTAQCSHMVLETPALSSVYDDDDGEEEEEEAAAAEVGNGVLILSTHLEYPAITNGAAHNGFAVMVRVKAPALVPAAAGRAPGDLVAVLDVRGSMAGAKLELVKRGMGFVIDRLSVVVFSDAGARRVVRLTCMSEDGKATARHAAAGSGPADLRGGLDEAAKVFDSRRHKNDNVAAVILLSDDGQDFGVASDDYSALVPPSFLCMGYRLQVQVHTLVFGADHDAAMHGVAEATGGTFL